MGYRIIDVLPFNRIMQSTYRFLLDLPLAVLISTTISLTSCSRDSKPVSATAARGIIWERTSVTGQYEHAKGEYIATFPFHVEGRDMVTITHVEPDCSCLLSADQDQVYKPDSHGVITARFTPGIRTGEQDRTLKVHIAGMAEPQTLQLHITVPEVLRLSANTLIWKRDEKPEPKTLELEILTPMSVKGWNTTSEAFQVSVEPIEGQKSYRITVTPKEITTSRSSLLILETDYPHRPWDKVSITLRSGA